MKDATEEPKQNILAKPLEITPAAFDDKSVIELVDKLDKDMRSIVLNGGTKEGREECISMAHNVRKSKAHIDKVGAAVVKPLKDKAKVVDSQRREIKDKLENLAVYLRKPATDWEIKEAERQDLHRKRIQRIQSLKENAGMKETPVLQNNWVEMEKLYANDFEEYQGDADAHYTSTRACLEEAIVSAEKRDAEKVELERLRKLEAEQKKKEEEEEKKKKEEQIREDERKRIAFEQTGLAPPSAAPAAPATGLVAPSAAPADNPTGLVPPSAEPTPAPAVTEQKITRGRMRTVHNEIVDALAEHSKVDVETAKSVVVAIARKQIPNLSINYE